MYEPCMQFNSDFIAELWTRLNPPQIPGIFTHESLVIGTRQNPVEVSVSPLPTNEDFVTILSHAFWASLAKEEGRPVTFSLSYAEPLSMPNHALLFEKSVEFSQRAIVKIAPALSGPDDYLSIWRDPSGRLGIWGYSSVNTGRLQLRAVAPGVLVCGSEPGLSIAVITGQQGFFVDRTLLQPGSRVWSAMFRGEQENEELPLRMRLKVGALRGIATALRGHESGGTLLVVPPTGNWRRSVPEITYPAQVGLSRVKDAIDTLVEISRESGNLTGYPMYPFNEEYIRARREFRQTLEHVGRLATIDGATILDQDLQIIGFGGKISPLDTARRPVQVRVSKPMENVPDTEGMPASLGATRHQSTAQFVYDQRDALAITVSQDGTTTIYWWEADADSLAVVRDVEYALM